MFTTHLTFKYLKLTVYKRMKFIIKRKTHIMTKRSINNELNI